MDQGRFAPGTLIADRYRIVSLLGKGGMGEVYRADDLKLRLPVALKLLPPGVAADPGRLARFHNEVRVARQVSHPSVCRVHDIGEVDGMHFLTMEYVDGEDLASLLRRIGRLPRDKAKDVARQICAGLAAAHDGGVLHRDLKPANVMIDGRGRARLTDFGLAVAADEARTRGEVAGTPAYMAPEQVEGRELSARTDVYALGLVLYELFTGQPVFRADTASESLRLQLETPPSPPSRLVPDLEPAVERVILQCLAKNPAERPASAHAVAAALLGENALDAAIAAGETPSPEMVAAAATVGALRPATAWTCLVCGLAGLVLVAMQAERTQLHALAPLPKPPEALAERAKDLLAHLGYADPPADSASGLEVDSARLEYLRRQDASAARWDVLRTARHGPYLFYYRQSPQELVSTRWIPAAPWEGPPDLGRVLSDDPPLNLPGMTEVFVDALGRLTRFVAVPPRFVAGAPPPRDAEWSTILAEAGFDPAALRASTPRWVAPVDSDRKAAWDGTEPGQPDAPVHIEAAAHQGRLVYFEVQGPWVKPPVSSPHEPMSLLVAEVMALGLLVLLLGAGWVLVRRNLRLGRGDRRGAFRLALFGLASVGLGSAVSASHSTRLRYEGALLGQIVSLGLQAAMVVWMMYVALEPALRRRWPRALISWSRLLAGRFSDPLLGRDVLVGVLAGLTARFVGQVVRSMPAWFGRAPGMPHIVVDALSAPRHMVYVFFVSSALALVWSLQFLFVLYLVHALVRRNWLARALLISVFIVVALAGSEEPLVASVAGAIFGTIVVTVLVRPGLFACAVFLFTVRLLAETPLTLDWFAWYAGRSLLVLIFFAALLAGAFYTSLGGKPIFGRALFED